MGHKKNKGKGPRFQMFNVTYEDGSLSSNRRVDAEYLDLTYGDDLLDLARKAIEEQDAQIAERSNRRPLRIKSVVAA